MAQIPVAETLAVAYFVLTKMAKTITSSDHFMEEVINLNFQVN